MRISPRAAQRELIRRQILQRNKQNEVKKINILRDAFPEQRAAILDPAKLKAFFCTRRAAKSYTIGLYLFKEAIEHPGVSILYIALTRDSARKIMVKDVLKPINQRYKLGAKFNSTNLTFTLPNGSIIYLLGADTDEEEKEKLLGQKYKFVAIDESASFSIDLRDLVYRILKPAVSDYLGTIVLAGTPGNLTNTLFFDITNGVEKGWSVHKWDTFSNPYMAKNWKTETDELIKINPLVVDTPWFKQMYLGQWVVDTDNLVYKFKTSQNEFNELPLLKGEWIYLLGVDLGYEDDSAFVVVCYNEHDKTLFIIDVYKRSKMDINDVADKIKSLQKEYPIAKIVIDGSNKQAVETMKNRHELILEAADKRGKWDFIQLMNGELISGMIKVHKTKGQPLIQEYLGLIKATKVDNEEHPNCPNHAADAALYIWRFCYNFLGVKPVEPAKKGSPEFFDEEEERMRQNLFDQIRRDQEALNQDPFSDAGWKF